MKQTVNVTLSFSPNLIARLHRSLPKRKISSFTAEVLNKALDELQLEKTSELESAYAQLARDADRKAELKDWNECDVDDIENWEWYEE